MTHFELNKDRYRYFTGESGTVVEITLYYDRGGQTFMSSAPVARGIYFRMGEVYRGPTFINYTMGARAAQTCIMELPRKVGKQVEGMALLLDARIPELVELFKTSPRAAVLRAKEITQAAGCVV